MAVIRKTSNWTKVVQYTGPFHRQSRLRRKEGEKEGGDDGKWMAHDATKYMYH